ncbi:MAG TPA: TolC family protein, partial [Spirochaetia bacterium]
MRAILSRALAALVLFCAALPLGAQSVSPAAQGAPAGGQSAALGAQTTPAGAPTAASSAQSGALNAPTAALSLDQALDRADRGAEAIRLRELAVQKSRAAVTEAASRAWPHIDLQASASYLVNPFAGYTISKGEFGTLTIPPIAPYTSTFTVTPLPTSDVTIGNQLHNYFSAAATLTQPLFTWGKIANAVDLASLQADSAGNDLVAQRRDIA